MDLPTIKVKAASGSGFVIINAEDFNGAKHVKWSEAPAPQAPAKNEALTKPFEPPPVPELPKTEEPVPPVAQRRR